MPRLWQMIDRSSDAAFAVSDTMHVLAWNHQAEQIFGLAAAETVGRPCAEVVLAELPGGEPICGPACHGAVCFCRSVPFAVPRCVVRNVDGYPIPVSISSLVVSEAARRVQELQTRALVFVHRLDSATAAVPMPQPLRIHTLGNFAVVLNGQRLAVETWQRKCAVTVLKLLAMHHRSGVHRDRLIEALWPGVDEKRGRDRLKVAIYYLRQRFNDRTLVEFSDEHYALRRDALWVDMSAFEQSVTDGIVKARRGRLDDAMASFASALRIYRGDFFEKDAYDDWCSEERERLRELFFDAVERLATALIGKGHHTDAAQACRRAISREPCREVFHRLLMESLIGMGRTVEAMQQFRRCRAILARELSVEPMPETRQIYENLRSATRNSAPVPRKP